MRYSTHVEAREHTCGVGTLLLLCGSQGLTQVTGLGSKPLYPLSLLTSLPKIFF